MSGSHVAVGQQDLLVRAHALERLDLTAEEVAEQDGFALDLDVEDVALPQVVQAWRP